MDKMKLPKAEKLSKSELDKKITKSIASAFILAGAMIPAAAHADTQNTTEPATQQAATQESNTPDSLPVLLEPNNNTLFAYHYSHSSHRSHSSHYSHYSAYRG